MFEDTHPSTHPPLPPTTEDDRISWLRLLRSRRVGTSTFYRLLREHGTAQSAIEALPELALAAGVKEYAPCPSGVAEAEWRRGHAAGAQFICITDSTYPNTLKNIADPPPFLWTMGDARALSQPCVALVGARNASSLGTRMAKSLASELSEAGFYIVSGLARGIDTAAHSASLEGGTIAVMAGGVDVIYPAENARLGLEIVKNSGARMSEQPIGLTPQARHFPARNRIISGMASVVVIVEAAAKSGSLITARNAIDQGREVLAVPGHPFDARAAGCNLLIRDGAVLVRSAADVIEAMPTQEEPAQAPLPKQSPDIPKAIPQPLNRQLSDVATLHSQILERLGPSPLAEDQLIRDLSVPAQDVTPALVDLELKGEIQRDAGGLLRRADPPRAN